MKRQVKELQPRDRDWIQQSAVNGRQICHHYGVSPTTSVSPAILDTVFHAWWHDKGSDRVSIEDVVNGLGCLFGELLRGKFDTVWRIVTDKFGTDLMLEVKLPTNNLEIAPLSFVAKRAESKEDESGFFTAMESMLLRESKQGA